ncbi:RNase H family protein, partial [Cryptosporangium minutisporangium]
MVDQAAPADDKRVVIYASGSGGTSPGAGGWGALLTHGDSQRELSGVEAGVTRDRMSLLAVVSALECLTRPTAVQVLTDNEYVRDGVAARTQGAVADDRNADLWTRLGAAVTRHRVQWVVVNAALAARAAALAAAAASPTAPRAASPRPTAPPPTAATP